MCSPLLLLVAGKPRPTAVSRVGRPLSVLPPGPPARRAMVQISPALGDAVGKGKEIAGGDAAGKAKEALGGGKNMFIVKAMVGLLPSTYLVWYGVVFALTAAFGLGGGNFFIQGLEPFDHVVFSPLVDGSDWRPLVHWLSMVLTMAFACPLMIYSWCRKVPDSTKATECSTAINAIHFFLCTTVTQQTPENWIWWATFMPCGLFMGKMAQFMMEKGYTPPREKMEEDDDAEAAPPYSKSS